MSVAVGIDSHKATLVAAAVDEVGRPLASQVFDNDPKGHQRALEWIVGLGEQRVVGIECSGSYGAALAWHLMDRGEDVREVPTRAYLPGAQAQSIPRQIRRRRRPGDRPGRS